MVVVFSRQLILGGVGWEGSLNNQHILYVNRTYIILLPFVVCLPGNTGRIIAIIIIHWHRIGCSNDTESDNDSPKVFVRHCYYEEYCLNLSAFFTYT